MNGGRLSNDEAFLQGVEEFRQELDAGAPDADAAERALARIAIRYPEEAETLRELWPEHPADCQHQLRALVAQHAADSETE